MVAGWRQRRCRRGTRRGRGWRGWWDLDGAEWRRWCRDSMLGELMVGGEGDGGVDGLVGGVGDEVDVGVGERCGG